MQFLLSLLVVVSQLASGFLFQRSVSVGTITSRNRKNFLAAGAEDWIDLTENGGVCKQILEEGSGDQPYESGTSVVISYAGTICHGDDGWNKDDVVKCWLLEQQGLDNLVESFLAENIDENKLTDTDGSFTEEFIKEKLGVENKIARKKLVMAAKRLSKSRKEYPDGTEFDSNDSYEFVLGAGKVIKGMEIGIASMQPGEKAKIRIRSDYAYGSEGCRKANGDVLVPPFATLAFTIDLQ